MRDKNNKQERRNQGEDKEKDVEQRKNTVRDRQAGEKLNHNLGDMTNIFSCIDSCGTPETTKPNRKKQKRQKHYKARMNQPLTHQHNNNGAKRWNSHNCFCLLLVISGANVYHLTVINSSRSTRNYGRFIAFSPSKVFHVDNILPSAEFNQWILPLQVQLVPIHPLCPPRLTHYLSFILHNLHLSPNRACYLPQPRPVRHHPLHLRHR